MAGIYIHIPFCRQACHYCDFHFSTQQDLRSRFVDAVQEEIRLQRDFLGNETVETVYFGGGTPSLLPPEELDQILRTLHSTFRITTNAEVTLEANPDDLQTGPLARFREAGINRLSIGIQSFQDDTLRFFNRSHSASEAFQRVEQARHAGFDNISLDLIYGIPGKPLSAWQADIARALRLQPEHLSAYALTLEEKTVFGHWHKMKKLIPADDESVAQQFEYLMAELDKAGYEHYEISNFCRPGFISRHNSAYWRGVSYLGLGPSAHSFRGQTRQHNIANNALYIQSIAQGVVPFTLEVLNDAERINEIIYTGLRTRWGVDPSILKFQFGFDLVDRRRALLRRLEDSGWLMWQEKHIALTRKGKLVADQIATDLFIDDAELAQLKKSF